MSEEDREVNITNENKKIINPTKIELGVVNNEIKLWVIEEDTNLKISEENKIEFSKTNTSVEAEIELQPRELTKLKTQIDNLLEAVKKDTEDMEETTDKPPKENELEGDQYMVAYR